MKDRKEEILKKYANGWVGGMTSGDEDRIVYPAMEEYASIRERVLRENFAKVVKAYEDYRVLLEDEIDELVSMVFVHDWESKRYEAGVKLRAALSEAKAAL